MIKFFFFLNSKLFRIIPKKKNSLIFLKNLGGGGWVGKAPLDPIDSPPLDAGCHRR